MNNEGQEGMEWVGNEGWEGNVVLFFAAIQRNL